MDWGRGEGWWGMDDHDLSDGGCCVGDRKDTCGRVGAVMATSLHVLRCHLAVLVPGSAQWLVDRVIVHNLQYDTSGDNSECNHVVNISNQNT